MNASGEGVDRADDDQRRACEHGERGARARKACRLIATGSCPEIDNARSSCATARMASPAVVRVM